MAQSALYGVLASAPTGTRVPAIHANSFTMDYSQTSSPYFGFGDYWNQAYGGLASVSGTISGFTTKGVAANSPGKDLVSGTTGAARVSEPWTFTWATGCTVIFNIIFTAVNHSVNFLGTDTMSISYISDGVPGTETWATS